MLGYLYDIDTSWGDIMVNKEEWEDEFLPPMKISEDSEIREQIAHKDSNSLLEQFYLRVLIVFIIFTLSSAFFGQFLPKENEVVQYSFDNGDLLVDTQEKSIYVRSKDSFLTYFPYKTGYTFYYMLKDGREDKMLAYWEEDGRSRLISLHNEMPPGLDYWAMVEYLKEIPLEEEKRPSKLNELSRYTWFRMLAVSMTCVLAPQLYWFFWTIIPSRAKAYSTDYHFFEGYDDGYQGVKIRKEGKVYLVVSAIFFVIECFMKEPIWPFW